MDKFVKDLIQGFKKINMPEIKPLGNGLYQFPNGIIGNERFLQEFDDAVRKDIDNKK